IPLALGGHDLIACAETGTGKTAAFVVPTLQRLLIADLKVGTTPGSTAVGTAADSTGVGTTPDTTAVRNATDESQTVVPRSRVLVLAPTRELAVQIEDEIHGLSY